MRLVRPTAIESGESADALIDRYVENYKDAPENEASIAEPTHTDNGKPAEAVTRTHRCRVDPKVCQQYRLQPDRGAQVAGQ